VVPLCTLLVLSHPLKHARKAHGNILPMQGHGNVEESCSCISLSLNNMPILSRQLLQHKVLTHAPLCPASMLPIHTQASKNGAQQLLAAAPPYSLIAKHHIRVLPFFIHASQHDVSVRLPSHWRPTISCLWFSSELSIKLFTTHRYLTIPPSPLHTHATNATFPVH